MKRLLLAAFLTLLAGTAAAHYPVCGCKKIEGGKIRCVGGFSDGSTAPGVTIDVIGYDEQILVHGKTDDASTFEFAVPEGEYYVLFDAGPGHTIEIDHTDIP